MMITIIRIWGYRRACSSYSLLGLCSSCFCWLILFLSSFMRPQPLISRNGIEM